MRYIELNPVRAGMVAHSRNYPWSSYHCNAHGKQGLNSDWISPHEEYLRLGGDASDRQGAYRLLFRAAISGNDLKEISDCTQKGWALGCERCRDQIGVLGSWCATSKGEGLSSEL